MKIFIVGTGMDGKNTLTAEGKNAIERSGLIIGAKRLVKQYNDTEKEIFVSYDPLEIAKKIKECCPENAAVLMSGDCGFFSGAKKLVPVLEKIGNCEIKVICGISSAVYLCSRVGISYENMRYISLHGVESNISVNVRTNEKCFFILGGKMSVSQVCENLCRYGMHDVNVTVGEDLGCENEKITSGTADDLRNYHASDLSSMIVLNEKYLDHIPCGIGDDMFIRSENIPMTKSEVRCIAVSSLNISDNSVCWDIGCGTGSVSVEMAFRCRSGKVLSFDRNNEACSLTRENSEHFGCDNILVFRGNCPGILDNAEIPDKIFIGGSSGNMNGIFEKIRGTNPRADIAAAAASLETLNETVSLFEKFGGKYSVVQIMAARTQKTGRYSMLKAMNPVFIIKGRLSE